MPPRLRSSFARSRRTLRPSFFGIWSISPESTCALQLAELRDACVHGLEVREHAAEPAEVHVRHAARSACRSTGSCACFFVPTKSTVPPSATVSRTKRYDGVDAVEGLVQVDDVDPVALAEDETPHLRVPAPGLVAEMDSGLQTVASWSRRPRPRLPWFCFRPRERRSVFAVGATSGLRACWLSGRLPGFGATL